MIAAVIVACLVFCVWVVLATERTMIRLREERDALQRELDREKFFNQRFDGTR